MGDFDWNIWFAKLGKKILIVAGATALFEAAKYIEANPLPPEYVFWGGVVATIFFQVGNYVKHKYW
jgi:hypothetical protein